MKKNMFVGLYIIMAILLVLPFVLPNSFYVDLAIRMAINAVTTGASDHSGTIAAMACSRRVRRSCA